MEINEAIAGRHSVREYKEEGVDEAIIMQLIEAAVRAPSAMNEQPWTFTVLRNQQTLDRISNEAKELLLKTTSLPVNSDQFQVHLNDPSFHIFYHAPVLILISANAKGPEVIEDCAMAAQNLMLAAYALGLGTCWIGLAQNFLNTYQGKHILGIPSAWIAVAPIIVGHSKAPTMPVPRKKPEIRFVG